MNLEGKKVLVVGLGKTGEAVCQFLLSRGAQVKVSEKKTKEELGEKISHWIKEGVILETGRHRQQSFLEADLIVPSPGVPPLPELKTAKEQSVRIISEIELAYNFLRGKIVGITGSNGKSTTASLTHKILQEGGVSSYLGGNIGTPLISFADHSKNGDVFVTEISSFQLQYVERFKVSVSVFLNLSPDHLDWHPSFSDYYEAKKKLIRFQGEEETAILNRDNPFVWDLHTEAKAQIYAFSRREKVCPGCFIDDDWMVIADPDQKKFMKISEIPLFGVHNQENVMAAALVGRLFSLSPSTIRESIRRFKGLEHRLEKVTVIKRVDFYNDSKATNVDAALKSILSFEGNIILIAGGRDKGGDFEKLRKPAQDRVKRIILLGEAKQRLKEALRQAVPTDEASSLEEAVVKAFQQAKPGDVVLLAPACTSFDMFENFEERGRIFKQAVLRLKQGQEKKKEN
jgi:UDP-N-acetylmuramoylalanine--D-glutamate ligase